jgi:rare lipoprotein A
MKKFVFAMLFISLFCYKLYADFPRYLYGVASWYGDEYEGKRTASGEIYRAAELTAAHRSLPFGSVLEVENLENSRKVMVTVNDRGPFVENRIIDLSKKAAERLGFLEKGTTYVKITVLELGEATEEEEAVTPVTETSRTTQPADTTSRTNGEVAYGIETVERIETNHISSERMTVITNYVLVTNYHELPYERLTITNRLAERNVRMDDIEDKDDAFVPGSIFDERVESNMNVVDLDDDDFDDDFIKSIETAGFVTDTNNDKPIGDKPSDKNAIELDFDPSLWTFEDVPILTTTTQVTPDLLMDDKDKKAIEREKNSIQEEIVREAVSKDMQADIVVDKYGFSYAVQVGAFQKESNALRLYDRLRREGFSAFMTQATVRGKGFTRVRVGYFDSIERAQREAGRLKSIGLPTLLVQIEFSAN